MRVKYFVTHPKSFTNDLGNSMLQSFIRSPTGHDAISSIMLLRVEHTNIFTYKKYTTPPFIQVYIHAHLHVLSSIDDWSGIREDLTH